jgi:hypothetical protein
MRSPSSMPPLTYTPTEAELRREERAARREARAAKNTEQQALTKDEAAVQAVRNTEAVKGAPRVEQGTLTTKTR